MSRLRPQVKSVGLEPDGREYMWREKENSLAAA
jgi:hypothetical protein